MSAPLNLRSIAPIANEAAETLRAALKMLSAAPPQPGAGPAVSDSKDAICDAASLLRKEGAKVGMLFTQNMITTSEMCASALEGVQKASIHFCGLVHSLTAGKYCRKQLADYARRAVEAFIEVLQAIAAGTTDLIPRLIGRVWEACDEVPRAPFDDRTAMGRAVARISRTLRDVQRELDDMKVSDGATRGGAAAAQEEDGEEEEGEGGGGEEDDDFGDDFGTDFGEEDMKVVAAVKVLLEQSQSLLKRILKGLLQSGPLDRPEQLEPSETCVDECAALQRELEDATASCYPPIDPKEVTAAASKALACVRRVCQLELAWLERRELQSALEEMEEAVRGLTGAVGGLEG